MIKYVGLTGVNYFIKIPNRSLNTRKITHMWKTERMFSLLKPGKLANIGPLTHYLSLGTHHHVASTPTLWEDDPSSVGSVKNF